MIATFAVMLLSGMGQPALLYLVPFTLIISAVVAGCRGEMRQFWAGTTYEVRGPEREFKVILYTFSTVVLPDSYVVTSSVLSNRCQYISEEPNTLYL